MDIDYRSLEYCGNELAMQHLMCPICQSVLVQPHTTECGHTFCKECLDKVQSAFEDIDLHQPRQDGYLADADLEALRALKFSHRLPFLCPIDRKVLKLEDTRPAPFVISSMVDDLQVKCPNEGCSFQDKRWLLSKHLETHCDFVLVPCGGPLGGTGLSGVDLSDTDLSGTVTDDLERETTPDTTENGPLAYTRYCERQVLRKARRPNRCVHVEIECPSGCGHTCAELALEEHLQECKQGEASEQSELTNIPSEPIRCIAHGFGCEFETTDKDPNLMETHQKSCIYSTIKQMNDGLCAKIEHANLENSTLRAEVERLSRANAMMHDQQEETALTNSRIKVNESEVAYVSLQCERLRRDVERLLATTDDSHLRQSEVFMREMSDEVALLRTGLNTVRNQLHFLLSERRMRSTYLPLQGYTAASSTSSSNETSSVSGRTSQGSLTSRWRHPDPDHLEPFRDVRL